MYPGIFPQLGNTVSFGRPSPQSIISVSVLVGFTNPIFEYSNVKGIPSARAIELLLQ